MERHLVCPDARRRRINRGHTFLWAPLLAVLSIGAATTQATSRYLALLVGVTKYDEKTIRPYVSVMQGLALLGQEKYAEAAESFLQTDNSIPNPGYGDFVSPNDVAIYGGLLALATMDRVDMQRSILDNPSFRTFLELEPHIRRAITQFVSGRYSACLAILESYRADFLLDLYLQKHIPAIYAQIRRKCIVQYLIPFSRVTLDSMNEVFTVSSQPLEDELATMIRSGVLDARIDTIDKVILKRLPLVVCV